MKLNNIEVPAISGRGRAFPYKDTGPQYVGPVNLNNTIMVVKVWVNESRDGRSYLRMIFETVEESQFELTD